MKRLGSFLLVIAALTLSAARADAAFQIQFESNGNLLTVIDNVVLSGDSNGTLNIINVDGNPLVLGTQPITFEGYSISASTGEAFMTPGGASDPGLGLTDLSVTNTGATDQLTITITANDFFFPIGENSILLSSASLSTSSVGSATYNWTSYFCQTNLLYCTTGVAAPTLNLSVSGNSADSEAGNSGAFFISGNYSLTSIANLTLTQGNIAVLQTGNSRIVATPEPGSLALLGFGLCAVGAAVRRRRSTSSRN